MKLSCNKLLIAVILLMGQLELYAQSKPLVLQRADSMSFNRKVGKMGLYRNVYFTHDSLEFRTQRAHWNRRTDLVDFRGGFEFLHPKGQVLAKTGRYNRKKDFAQAWKNVFMRDSLGEVTLEGDTLEFSRKTGVVEVWGHPVLKRNPPSKEIKAQMAAMKDSLHVEQLKESGSERYTREQKFKAKKKEASVKKILKDQANSYSHANPQQIVSPEKMKQMMRSKKFAERWRQKNSRISSNKSKKKRSKNSSKKFSRSGLANSNDTLSVRALKLKLQQNTQDAFAYDSVIIDKGSMHVTCDSALFQYKKGYLKLFGRPFAQVGSYSVKGEQMEIWFNGESLERIKVTRNAFGASKDTVSRPGDIQWTEVEGDSMQVFFANDEIDSLTVAGSGEGRFYDESTKEYKNKVNGRSLVIDFINSQPTEAKVREEARTKYFYFKSNGDFGGWNEARGDSLDIGFNGGKLMKIAIQGNLASGVFMGESKSENKKSTKSSTESKGSSKSKKKSWRKSIGERKAQLIEEKAKRIEQEKAELLKKKQKLDGVNEP